MSTAALVPLRQPYNCAAFNEAVPVETAWSYNVAPECDAVGQCIESLGLGHVIGVQLKHKHFNVQDNDEKVVTHVERKDHRFINTVQHCGDDGSTALPFMWTLGSDGTLKPTQYMRRDDVLFLYERLAAVPDLETKLAVLVDVLQKVDVQRRLGLSLRFVDVFAQLQHDATGKQTMVFNESTDVSTRTQAFDLISMNEVEKMKHIMQTHWFFEHYEAGPDGKPKKVLCMCSTFCEPAPDGYHSYLHRGNVFC